MPLPLVGQSVGNRKVVADKVAGDRVSKSNGVGTKLLACPYLL
jgi:hypothetical protein